VGKRIALLVRDRPAEALRVAVGLTLADNTVEVFVLDPLPPDDAAAAVYLEVLAELRLPVRTTVPGNAGLASLPVAALARELLGFDHILAY
jgi:hypothetical protein